MRRLQPARFHCVATLALIAGVAACEAPVAPEDPPEALAVVAAAHRAAAGEAGIPITVNTVARIVSIEQCASDAERGRLTLVGTGRAAGLGPFELEYGYCVPPPFTDWSIVLRTRAGELRFLPLGGTGAIPSDHPDFDIEAHDIWKIVDGTGKFRDASGELQADFYANLTEDGRLVDGAITTLLSGTISLGSQ
ncbi:MAG TPA: hypothetical protein VMN39_10125 [Longimicrobiaceae bacterium]|nr:hypothetical protein [Longimicrobiaceae bacterium]